MLLCRQRSIGFRPEPTYRLDIFTGLRGKYCSTEQPCRWYERRQVDGTAGLLLRKPGAPVGLKAITVGALLLKIAWSPQIAWSPRGRSIAIGTEVDRSTSIVTLSQVIGNIR